jgi:hypothetical protein
MDPLLGPPAAPAGARSFRVVWERAAELAAAVFEHGDGAGGEGAPPTRESMRASSLAVATCVARAAALPSAGRRAELIRALAALSEVESHLLLGARILGRPAEDSGELRRRIEVLRRLILALGNGAAASSREPRPT